MASVWTGVVTFGLVSIPIKLYVAARPETVSFNQLHSVCRSRLRQKLYCPTCERDVERGPDLTHREPLLEQRLGDA